MAEPVAAPVLSTPAEALLEQTSNVAELSHRALPTEQLDIQYEIRRTVDEIRARRWKRIALQFPDEMLADAPSVFDRLRNVLRESRTTTTTLKPLQDLDTASAATRADDEMETGDERLSILGDTSYGACCVDEIAAEHVSADGIVHYGRSCLSPTQRFSVIYVYTSPPLDTDHAISSFQDSFPVKSQQVCILADAPWQRHVSGLAERLREHGYDAILAPELVNDPASILPNRALPDAVTANAEVLKDTMVWHIGKPPTALLLALTSRVKEVRIYDPAVSQSDRDGPNVQMMLRRRYAALLKLSSAAVVGILINTLSVKNYLSALQYVQDLITAAGKKSYTFVVGKLNPPKLANFAEVDGWVVIGCWESSLIDSKDFLAPVVTPFELELALADDGSRVWGQEWISDFQTLLHRRESKINAGGSKAVTPDADGEDIMESDEDDPPEFDLRTGRYVSSSRPIRSSKAVINGETDQPTKSSTALVKRAQGDLATVNGVASPGADFLRSKRQWQGLGSDYEVAYDRDESGNIQGAAMEQGRSGVAKGYVHPQHEARS